VPVRNSGKKEVLYGIPVYTGPFRALDVEDKNNYADVTERGNVSESTWMQ
jgi:hypothetical protein